MRNPGDNVNFIAPSRRIIFRIMINSAITGFLKQQTCATICCLDDSNSPHCFSCYYAFDETQGLLYFKSSAGALHGSFLVNHPAIAGTVLPDKAVKLITRGVQLKGEVLLKDHPLTKEAYAYYHKRFPIALAMQGEMYTINLSWIKLTDSSQVFGMKTIWNRTE